MKNLLLILSMIGFFMTDAQAFGLQHGLFRSQSTQGNPWKGKATIIQEQFNITVYADYLDVEMDWVFEVTGNVPYLEHRLCPSGPRCPPVR